MIVNTFALTTLYLSYKSIFVSDIHPEEVHLFLFLLQNVQFSTLIGFIARTNSSTPLVGGVMNMMVTSPLVRGVDVLIWMVIISHLRRVETLIDVGRGLVGVNASSKMGGAKDLMGVVTSLIGGTKSMGIASDWISHCCGWVNTAGNVSGAYWRRTILVSLHGCLQHEWKVKRSIDLLSTAPWVH